MTRSATSAFRATAKAFNRKIIFGTPIDTGMARAHWVGSIGSPDLSYSRDEPPFPEGKGSDGYGETILRKANRIVNQCQLGQTYFLSNNLPYINRLEYEHKAGGWIRAAQMEMKYEWPYRFRSAFRNKYGSVTDDQDADSLAEGGESEDVFSR